MLAWHEYLVNMESTEEFQKEKRLKDVHMNAILVLGP